MQACNRYSADGRALFHSRRPRSRPSRVQALEPQVEDFPNPQFPLRKRQQPTPRIPNQRGSLHVLDKSKKHRGLSRLDPEKRFDGSEQLRSEGIGPDQSIPGFPSGTSLAGVREDASPRLSNLFQERIVGVVHDHPDRIFNGPAAAGYSPERKMPFAIHKARQEVNGYQGTSAMTLCLTNVSARDR